MKKLDKLNVAFGSIQSPSTSVAPSQPVALSITLLSLSYVEISSPIDPFSLPLLRSLTLCYQTCQPVQLLLPQLASLTIRAVFDGTDLASLIQESTSITSESLALDETLLEDLDGASKTVIQERIVEFRLQVSKYGASSDSALTTIIDGSKVMKKVILDGIHLNVVDQVSAKLLETLKVGKEACKKKKVELWKENFEVGNGKVDLEK
jgi:hypothetical protein